MSSNTVVMDHDNPSTYNGYLKMRSPFPGMNPYLESPVFWSAFHSRLIVAIADSLAPNLLPNYYIEIETRTYLSNSEESLLVGIPDAVIFSPQAQSVKNSTVSQTALLLQPKQIKLSIPEEVTERYLEIREVATGQVITVIEVLSPKNKTVGVGRTTYLQKRQTILTSLTHWIEIDLLRGGQPMSVTEQEIDSDYRILVSRSYQRPYADLYEFSLRESIPNFPLPLREQEPEPIIPLQQIIEGIYERGGYHFRIDYQQLPPPPALSPFNLEWLKNTLSAEP